MEQLFPALPRDMLFVYILKGLMQSNVVKLFFFLVLLATMSKGTKQQSDGYGDMPLNTRQQNAVSIIKQWYPVTQDHAKCVKTLITVISNVLYYPTESKYQKLRLSKPKLQKVIVNIVGGIKLLKLAGFQESKEDNGEKILCIESPTTIEEFEQLTDIWLVLLKTQYLWGINPDKNAPKGTPLPTQFTIPNTIKYAMNQFFETNEIAKSTEFQELVKNSNNPNLSPTALERYTYFAKAIKLLIAADTDFFNLDAKHGLNDIDASDVAALIVSEILCGYYDEDAAYTNLILAEDLRIIAEKEKEFMRQQYQITSNVVPVAKDNNDDIDAEKSALAIVEDDDDDEKKDEMKNEDDDTYKVIDIGCGWGNFGRLLMDKELRPYLKEIETESELKKVDIYGYDISQDMISIAKDNGFDKYYKDMITMDCKRGEISQFKDGSIDVIISCNCIMQDKKMGHPSEIFLVEANRLLKDNGWFVVSRRFHGVHLGLQLYAYIMIAQQLGWKNVFASRIREVFYIGWQKMVKPK